MADIKQAAKWMKEGKKVRRRAWVGDMSCYLEPGFPESSNIMAWKNQFFTFIANDLLADDWEIAN